MVDYYKRALSKYAIFEGRDTLPEYWYYVLFNAIVYVGLALLLIIGLIIDTEAIAIGAIVLGGLYRTATLIPSIAAASRRLHDTGKSALFLLLYFVPFGALALIILLAQQTQQCDNKYGDEPELEELKLKQFAFDENEFV